jgi:hypothetical protein
MRAKWSFTQCRDARKGRPLERFALRKVPEMQSGILVWPIWRVGPQRGRDLPRQLLASSHPGGLLFTQCNREPPGSG